MFWIHAIWKYVNGTLVSVLSKVHCNHSLDLTTSVHCIFTELNTNVVLLSGRPGFKPLQKEAFVLLECPQARN